MIMDKDLTVILVIKDRVPYTFRWMMYADRTSFPFKVLVADGGKDSRIPEKMTKTSNYPNLNYEYLQYHYDQTYSQYYAKMSDSLSKVETPFVAVTDDACFYLVEGLRHSIEFLQTNIDYSVCGGNIGSFSVWPDKNNSLFNPAYGDEVFFFSNLYQFQQITEETSADRVANHFAHYCPTCYDVHRTKQLQAYFALLKKIDFRDIFLAELLTSFLALCDGNARRLSELFMVRQIKNRSSCAGDHRKKWGDEFDRMLLESWSDDFSKFVDAIASAISDKDRISFDDAKLRVKKGYRSHIAPQIINQLSIQNVGLQQNVIINGIKNIVRKLRYDSASRHFLYKLYENVFKKKNEPANQNLPIHKSSKFYKDIKPLQNFLTSPPDDFTSNGS